MHDELPGADWNSLGEGPGRSVSEKEIARIRRDLERERVKNDAGSTPFDLSTGHEATHRQPNATPPAPLFGHLWHEGEVALLAGPAGSGKSVLAVQIADQLARVKRSGSPPHKAGVSARVFGEQTGWFSQPGEGSMANHVDCSSRGGDPPRRQKTPTPILLKEGNHGTSLDDNNPFKTTAPPQKVLYVDFTQTAAQFAERYSAPHPLPGKLPLRHRFPPNFTRAGLGQLESIPPLFQSAPHKYFHHWLMELIEQTEPRALILDNLAYLAPTLTGPQSAAATAKNLKWWCQRYCISILATVNTRPFSPPGLRRGADAASAGWSTSSARKPATLADIAAAPPLTDLADTVFTLSPSILAPDLRYIKHLKCRRETDDYSSDSVIACQLGRTLLPEKVSSSSSAPIPHSSFRTPHSVSPFLRLTYLGLSPESAHLTDPFAQPRKEKRIPPRIKPALPKPRWKMSAIEMLCSREYIDYLEP